MPTASIRFLGELPMVHGHGLHHLASIWKADSCRPSHDREGAPHAPTGATMLPSNSHCAEHLATKQQADTRANVKHLAMSTSKILLLVLRLLVREPLPRPATLSVSAPSTHMTARTARTLQACDQPYPPLSAHRDISSHCRPGK